MMNPIARNYNSINPETCLTSNSILDILSIARLRRVAITVAYIEEERRYRLKLTRGDHAIVRLISDYELDNAVNDVRYVKYVLADMCNQMDKCYKEND